MFFAWLISICMVLYTLLFNIYFFPFLLFIPFVFFAAMKQEQEEQEKEKIDPKYRRHYQSEFQNAYDDTMKKILYYGSMVLFALLLNYLFNILW